MFDGIYQNRNVLVTGHTGFKGAWLSLWLTRLKANVIGYALKPLPKPNLFELCNLQNKLSHIEGDVRDFDHLKHVVEEHRPEIVFHMAAQSLVRYSYKNPIETFATNVMGTAHVLEAVRQTGGVKVIIILTSDKCYENKEWGWCHKESDPMGGHDPYSSSKGCAELVTNAYLRSFFNPEYYAKHTVSLASVRAGNVIGGGDWAEDRLIPDCMRAIAENRPIVIRYPDAVRPWQHVLEPLSGYLLLSQRLYQEGCKFAGGWNFGPNDEAVKPVKWIVEQITEMWGGDSTWMTDQSDKPHEANYLRLDCSKSKSKINWHPQWNLRFALEKTVEWYKDYYKNDDILNLTISQIESYESNFAQEGSV